MKATTAVIIATLYLFVFYVLLHFIVAPLFTAVVFISVPIVIIAMVLIVLLDDSKAYPELADEEWGYADKNKDELGMF